MININIQTTEFSFGLSTSITDPVEIKARLGEIIDATLRTNKLYYIFLGGPIINSERIRAIKAVRTVTRLGLREAKDIVDAADVNTSRSVKLPIIVEEKDRVQVITELTPWFSSVEAIIR
jgi:ribosomal protein L7/L12